MNGAQQLGFTRSHGTLRDGLRCSTAKGFLRPVAKRRNLHISLNSHAEKIILEGEQELRATGVVINKQGRGIVHTRAKREVILCAGAIGSPQVQHSAVLSFSDVRSNKRDIL